MKIQILRRDPEKLTSEEDSLLREKLGQDAELIRTDPTDCNHHMELTKFHGMAAALLPAEQPIPQIAMEAGVPQLVMLRDENGKLILKKLVGLKPIFEDV